MLNNLKKKKVRSLCFQGNLSPEVLLKGGKPMTDSINKILENFSSVSHIFNLGHGITPAVNPDSVEFLIKTVNKISSKIHG